MFDVVARDAVEGGFKGAVGDRRRPDRIADASPELIALMRRPASVSARVRVALYDAPGFMLPQAGARRSRGVGFVLRAGGIAAGLGMVATMACEAMILAWG